MDKIEAYSGTDRTDARVLFFKKPICYNAFVIVSKAFHLAYQFL